MIIDDARLFLLIEFAQLKLQRFMNESEELS
jgi:hypothetical protein